LETVKAAAPTAECDDWSLACPAPVRLASDETFDPSGMLLGTLNRVQSLTWSRHEFSWTVMAQLSQRRAALLVSDLEQTSHGCEFEWQTGTNWCGCFNLLLSFSLSLSF
jgi:hypothetical protein